MHQKKKTNFLQLIAFAYMIDTWSKVSASKSSIISKGGAASASASADSNFEYFVEGGFLFEEKIEKNLEWNRTVSRFFDSNDFQTSCLPPSTITDVWGKFDALPMVVT